MSDQSAVSVRTLSGRARLEPEIAQYPKSTYITYVLARGEPVPIRSSQFNSGRQGTLLTARTFGEYLDIAHLLIATTKGAAALALYRKRSRCIFYGTLALQIVCCPCE